MTKPIQIASLTLLVAFLVACGPGAREKTITTTLRAVQAAQAGFAAYDDQRQNAIVDHASTLEEGQRQLAAYRAERERTIDAFLIVYEMLAVAAFDKSDVNVANVLDAAARLYRAYRELTGRDPPTISRER